MLRLTHMDKMEALGKIKRLPKPDGTSIGTQPVHYNLNLASAWLIELAKVDHLVSLHKEIGSRPKPERCKEIAQELMKELYGLSDHLSPANYGAIYYHLSAALNG